MNRDSKTEAIKPIKPEEEIKNASHSISEPQSEVERSTPEAREAMTYAQVQVLSDIQDFIGLDEQTYALREGDVEPS